MLCTSKTIKSVTTILILNLLITSTSQAKMFDIQNGSDIVGKVFRASANSLKSDDNYLTIGERYGIGFHELEEANPGISPWSSSYNDIIIPHKYVLPKIRSGIVVNLAELRLYYFPKGSNRVYTYPVGIGKQNWVTPRVNTTVAGKVKDPAWTVPASIKEEYKKRGESIANVIPAGPDNPLGKYALRLSEPGYLIHGSNNDIGVGLRVSHGCIRLFNNDVKELYSMVPTGTQVHIINEPYKIGSDGNHIFLEAHKPLSEDKSEFKFSKESIRTRLLDLNIGYKVDWNATRYAADALSGIPAPIGTVRYVNSYLDKNDSTANITSITR